MKRKRFTEEQMIGILKEWESGLKIGEVARKHGISEKSLYYWRRKFGGMEVPEARRLKALEDENRKLKRIVADQALEITAIKDVLSKNW
jgi:putative transposase